MSSTRTAPVSEMRYRVTGMDCSACAKKIQNEVSAMPGVRNVHVSIASREMSLSIEKPIETLPNIERKVAELGYRLIRPTVGPDDQRSDLSHITPRYKRALWIVVLINVGYGLLEMVGGVLAGSQALKADALDFIGDGLISWLGMIAIGWCLAARAKAAVAQGPPLPMPEGSMRP